MDIKELQGAIVKAVADGNDAEFFKLTDEVRKMKAEASKAIAAQAQAEAEAMAGDRALLADKILEAVKAVVTVKELTAVKATGYTFRLPDDQSEKARVALTVPTVKVAKSGNGGASAGKSKDEYGVSLGEIFDKYATAEDKANLAEAETNSKQWQVKTAVKKRAIKEGGLKPL